MSKQIFFSVIIPAYNAERYISETLRSVTRQTYQHFEVIVVDDGSTDKTREIVQQHALQDSRLTLISCPQRSGGPAYPRNLGLEASRGDYVALLDSDDLWFAQKLENDAKFLSQTPTDILYSGAYYVSEDLRQISSAHQSRALTWWFLIVNRVASPTVCVARHVFKERHLYFDTDPLLVAIEDYHFLLSARLEGMTVICRPGIDCVYRQGSANSIYGASDFNRLLKRILYNMTKISIKYSLPWPKLCLILFLIVVRFSLQHAWESIFGGRGTLVNSPPSLTARDISESLKTIGAAYESHSRP